MKRRPSQLIEPIMVGDPSDRCYQKKLLSHSGFVISTILIKISFSTEGIVNNALIIGAVLFGFLILLIHNKFEQKVE